jgi:hypothetical protein
MKERGHPPRYGLKPGEQDILTEIVFMRQLKPGQNRRKSFQSIADDLNSQSKFPRRAKQWNGLLVFLAHDKFIKRGVL